MGQAHLTIDLNAVTANWRALDALSGGETGAVVKADAYGLGAAVVGPALQAAGARTFFVALAEEGVELRRAIGPKPRIFVFSGLMQGDVEACREFDLIPLLNSAGQVTRFMDSALDKCGLQLDTGMNRLGMELAELASIAIHLPQLAPQLVMSHLACADDPGDPTNAVQLTAFQAMTLAINAPKSLAATGGILLGAPYHFDLTRPGVGLYGGAPFAAARPVVTLSLPVIQTRTVFPGEGVGYGLSWRAAKISTIATVAAGYADGLIRAMGNKAVVYAGDTPCPVVGRVSMDLVTVDVSHLPEVPPMLNILNATQTVDVLAEAAGTIGYEILTSLGSRYKRIYKDTPC